MSKSIDGVAKSVFRVERLKPFQRTVIENTLLATKEKPVNQIAILPTGYGKSICFQLPALLSEGVTLVVYPLLSLMDDQSKKLYEWNIKAQVLRGGQTKARRAEVFNALRNGCRILITNPEMLKKPMVKKLCALKITRIVIDEAHCIHEWGDSFRPYYLNLETAIKMFGAISVSCFTATADNETLKRIKQVAFSGIDEDKIIITRGNIDRTNIYYHAAKCEDKEEAVMTILSKAKLPAIVFCSSRSETEIMAEVAQKALGGKFCDEDFARHYHAGLSAKKRNKIERWFFAAKGKVLFATCAYGMGVDKPDVRTIIHTSPPRTAQSYIQETGRAGRDGERADAILLFDARDSHRAFYTHNKWQLLYLQGLLCRRNVLISSMDCKEVECSGCDVCVAKAKEEETKASSHHFFQKLRQKNKQNTLKAPLDGPTKKSADDAESDFEKASENFLQPPRAIPFATNENDKSDKSDSNNSIAQMMATNNSLTGDNDKGDKGDKNAQMASITPDDRNAQMASIIRFAFNDVDRNDENSDSDKNDNENESCENAQIASATPSTISDADKNDENSDDGKNGDSCKSCENEQTTSTAICDDGAQMANNEHFVTSNNNRKILQAAGENAELNSALECARAFDAFIAKKSCGFCSDIEIALALNKKTRRLTGVNLWSAVAVMRAKKGLMSEGTLQAKKNFFATKKSATHFCKGGKVRRERLPIFLQLLQREALRLLYAQRSLVRSECCFLISFFSAPLAFLRNLRQKHKT